MNPSQQGQMPAATDGMQYQASGSPQAPANYNMAPQAGYPNQVSPQGQMIFPSPSGTYGTSQSAPQGQLLQDPNQGWYNQGQPPLSATGYPTPLVGYPQGQPTQTPPTLPVSAGFGNTYLPQPQGMNQNANLGVNNGYEQQLAQQHYQAQAENAYRQQMFSAQQAAQQASQQERFAPQAQFQAQSPTGEQGLTEEQLQQHFNGLAAVHLNDYACRLEDHALTQQQVIQQQHQTLQALEPHMQRYKDLETIVMDPDTLAEWTTWAFGPDGFAPLARFQQAEQPPQQQFQGQYAQAPSPAPYAPQGPVPGQNAYTVDPSLAYQQAAYQQAAPARANFPGGYGGGYSGDPTGQAGDALEYALKMNPAAAPGILDQMVRSGALGQRPLIRQ